MDFPFPLIYSQMNCLIEIEYIRGFSLSTCIFPIELPNWKRLMFLAPSSNKKGIPKKMPSPKLRPLKFKYFIWGWNHWILFRGLGASGLPPLCHWFLASFKKGLVKRKNEKKHENKRVEKNEKKHEKKRVEKNGNKKWKKTKKREQK